MIVSARGWDGDPSSTLGSRGAVFVFHGGNNGLPASPSWEVFGPSGNNYIDLGASISRAGDFNDDSFDDVLISAKSGGPAGDGSVRLFLGSANGLPWPAVESLRIEDLNTSDDVEFGSDVAGIGRFNTDGFDDIVIGARYQGTDGTAIVCLGNASATAPTRVPLASPTHGAGQSAGEFGQAVAALGDVNGDGLDDLVVGAWKFDSTSFDGAGRVDAYLGTVAPFSPRAPASYCAAKLNSQGCLPAIGYTGAPSLGGPDDFAVTAVQVVNQKSGLLFWGRAPAALAFQGGTKCVAAPTVRTPLASSAGGPPPDDCSGTLRFDFSHAYMTAQGIAAGDTLFAQWWTRDPASAPFHTGLSDALRFTISP